MINNLYFTGLNFINRCKYIAAAIGVMLTLFVAASLLDIVLAALHPRFYSIAAFMAIFGVAGIFAGVICYSVAMGMATVKNEGTRWSILLLLIFSGIAFFFPLATLEGGEYEAAFRSFGLTLALSSLLFVKGKIE